jgi:leucyl-tRNA synthetase
LFKAGLAYRKESEVNWCPFDKTVLADEQVMTPAQAGKEPKNAKGEKVKAVEGMMVCERCGTVVERKKLSQWHFRITDYADRLLEDLDKIDWPEKIKLAQRNWIGRSTGAKINFQVSDTDRQISVFTTRPDTLYGATFMVVSPEYAKENLMKFITKERKANVTKYINTSLKKSDIDRSVVSKDKTGVDTGVKAVNPATEEKIPVFVADYVLSGYGTGAIMGVPAHDQRDWEFAKNENLKVIKVVSGPDVKDQAHDEAGKLINSDKWNGITVPRQINKIISDIKTNVWGERTVNYHLRDWIISRQRYWGPPIPMIFCKKCAGEGRGWLIRQLNGKKTNKTKKNDKWQMSNVKLLHEAQDDWDAAGWWPEEDLPVELPKIDDYEPEGAGKGPLANHPEFYDVKCPECGSKARRETDVSDTFLDSAWYFLRYPSVASKSAGNLPFDADITKRWLPVDLYFGGAEHAVLHLMYSRFTWKVLNDLGYLNFKTKGSKLSGWDEPFPRFFAHGLMIKDGAKMSKSRGNVVNPDEYIEKFGADTLRLYTMFLGPMDGYPDFRDTGIEGMRRFVERVWDLVVGYKDAVVVKEEDAKNITIKMHQTIKKVEEDIQEFKYNTAIAAIMEYVNLLRETASQKKEHTTKNKGKTNHQPLSEPKALKNRRPVASYQIRCAEWDEAIKVLVQLLAPFAPYITEELWVDVLEQKYSVHRSSWPKFVAELIKEEMVEIVVQVNGKYRGTINVKAQISNIKNEVVKLAKNEPNIGKWLDGKQLKDTVFVKGKLVNFVLN